MVELKGLEDWARGILATSKTELNRRFGSWKKQDELRKSIEELPFFTRYRPVFCTLCAPTLRELHQKLRGQPCEQNFWIVLLEFLEHPLPDEITLDLIERYAANTQVISMLGHSRQSDSVMWKLAPLVDEALLTLAKSFYIDSNRTLEEFEKALRQFPNNYWMLESLGYCSASSLEKRRAYEKATENYLKRGQWLGLNPKIDPDQKLRSYFDISHYSELERMSALYGAYDFEKLLDIARDDQTPDEILHELEELREFSNAAKVRAAARHTLRRREETWD